MIEAVLFDLGNTLVRYWERAEFPDVLSAALAEVTSHLCRKGLLQVSGEEVWQRAQEHNHELPGHRVYRLEERLVRIFGSAVPDRTVEELCQCFVQPMFARGCLYPDTMPALEVLRTRGLRTGIVSNSPWGSPAALWRREIARLGLRDRVDVDVFCGDVGWRKPARQIFEHTLHKLGLRACECLFVGDDPRWDLAGPRAMGMEAIWLDRSRTGQQDRETPIHSLEELEERLDALGHDHIVTESMERRSENGTGAQ